jgi:hypothetical protein
MVVEAKKIFHENRLCEPTKRKYYFAFCVSTAIFQIMAALLDASGSWRIGGYRIGLARLKAQFLRLLEVGIFNTSTRRGGDVYGI